MKNIIILLSIMVASISMSFAQLVSIQDPTPTITVDPANTATCHLGNASFTVTANVVGGFTSQWYVDNGTGAVAVTNDATYSGAQTTTLNITSATNSMNNYQYYCVVTSTNGGCTAQSANATLTVNPLANITLQPANTTGCEGSTVNITITAAAVGGVSYQWQEDNGTGWANIADAGIYSGSTTNTLTLTGLTNAMNGYDYRCVVTTTVGVCPLNSTSANLVVNPLPVVTVQPANTAVCENGNTSITITDNASTRQWQVNDGTGWVNIANAGVYSTATTASLTITGATVAMNNYQYRCVSTSAAGCVTTSNSMTLTVNPLATFALQPVNATVCENGNTSFTVTPVAVGGYSSQWQKNSGAGWVNITDDAIYSGSTTDALTITGAAFASNGTLFRCVVTTTVGSCPVNSSSATMTVNALPTIPTVSANGVVGKTGHYCIVGTVFSLGSSQLNYSYQLQDFGTSANVDVPINGTGGSISFPAQPTGQYKVQITSTSGCINIVQ